MEMVVIRGEIEMRTRGFVPTWLTVILLASLMQVGVFHADAAVAAPPGGGWVPIFMDEFHGYQDPSTRQPHVLNPYVWNQKDMFGAVRNNELQAYVPEAISAQDGVLRISATHEATQYDGKVLPYRSGIVTTYQKFQFLYGYFEMRVRVPATPGAWSAGWLVCSSMKYPCEIDLFEVLGDNPSRVLMSNHWGTDADHRSATHVATGTDLSDGWHTVGVAWRPSSIEWFVDGQSVHLATEGVPSEPMFMLLNVAVGGDLPYVEGVRAAPPQGGKGFPAQMDVDFVRVFSRDVKGR
jgi:beta-glucanase (GH16 family)